MNIHHVALTVRDIETSIAWYAKVFDANVSYHYADEKLSCVLLDLQGIRLELFSFNDKTAPLPEYRKELFNDIAVVGTKHVCFEVEDIHAIKESLTNKDVTFVTEIDSAGFGGRYVFLKDPDGILIELYQRA